MALWHDFSWELNDASGMELSNAANVAISKGVVMTRRYLKGSFDCIVFSSRIPINAAVSVAAGYIQRNFDAEAKCVDKEEYDVRGYFTMQFSA